MYKRIAIISFIFLPLIFSCQEYSGDVSDGYVKEKADKAEFAKNFESVFGKIDPKQTWDFTGNRGKITIPAKYGSSVTRATLDETGVSITTASDWTYPGKAFYTAVNDVFKSEGEHIYGLPSAMITNDKPFQLVPVYQGNCVNYWELWVTIGEGEDAPSYPILSKVRSNTSNPYIQSDRTVEGNSDASDGGWVNLYRTANWSGQYGAPSTEDWTYEEYVAEFRRLFPNRTPMSETDFNNSSDWKRVYGVRSHAVEFNIPANTPIFFYLVVSKHDQSGAEWTLEESSLKGDMLDMTTHVMSLYDGTKPSFVADNETFKILGMETNPEYNLIGQDDGSRDFCDIMFVLKGEKIPEILELEDGYDSTIEKRYLMEDLGSTFDFDFNDIVLDMKHTFHTDIHYTQATDAQGYPVFDDDNNPVMQADGITVSNPRQEAKISHLCGTIPFSVFVGDYQLGGKAFEGKGGGVVGSDGFTPTTTEEIAEYTFDLTTGLSDSEKNPWNYLTNNIKLEAKSLTSDNMYYNDIPFPKTGEAPMIIAVPVSQKWTKEHDQIDSSWFYVPESSGDDTNP